MAFVHNAGAIAVGIAPHHENRAILKRRADYVIENISELFSVIG